MLAHSVGSISLCLDIHLDLLYLIIEIPYTILFAIILSLKHRQLLLKLCFLLLVFSLFTLFSNNTVLILGDFIVYNRQTILGALSYLSLLLQFLNLVLDWKRLLLKNLLLVFKLVEILRNLIFGCSQLLSSQPLLLFKRLNLVLNHFDLLIYLQNSILAILVIINFRFLQSNDLMLLILHLLFTLLYFSLYHTLDSLSLVNMELLSPYLVLKNLFLLYALKISILGL